VKLAQHHQRLADHQATRPEMPRPFVADSPEALAWHKAFTKWVIEKDRLTRKLTAARWQFDRKGFLIVAGGEE
jgi:hypothetical protein